MARQKRGVVNLDGRAGTLSFFLGRDGYSARTSDGMNGKRIATNDRFARTRENGREFGRAGKAGKLLRTAFREISRDVSDPRVTGRLTAAMLRVVKSDPISKRGERTAANGDLTRLTGFEFNFKTPLSQSLCVPFEISIARATGTGEVSLPAFSPKKMLKEAQGASHYCFLMGICTADFDAGKSQRKVITSEPFDLETEAPARVLSVSLMEASEHPLFLVFGIEFIQMVNGTRYELQDVSCNALTIAAVDMDV